MARSALLPTHAGASRAAPQPCSGRAHRGKRALPLPIPAAARAYGPGLFVADAAAFEADGRHADGAALSLVGEFTSVSAQDAGWTDKLDVYGLLVPVYLVVDMQGSEITCFSDPSPHGYRSRTTVSFGEPLHVPEPFGCVIDSSGF
ncbi:Uma2 family endonuclease [Streptomyces sp. NPDC058674]|uniref:Uma2 family endonuclease n=1 Tax=Streptomyces sp. NPDC058674 TaxID=3346592 RepID=UPI00365B0034